MGELPLDPKVKKILDEKGLDVAVAFVTNKFLADMAENHPQHYTEIKKLLNRRKYRNYNKKRGYF